MNRIPGVQTVEVSLKSATTTIELADGNTLTLDRLREIIKKNGFQPGQARITATGRLTSDAGQLRIDLAPAKLVLTLVSGAGRDAALGDARKLLAEGAVQVEVVGTVNDAEMLIPMQVRPRADR